MRRIAGFIAVTLWGVAAYGQSLIDCVDPDVVNSLLRQGQAERSLVTTSEIPRELTALQMPAGFSWIGAAHRVVGIFNATTNASQVTAAWRSNLSPESARSAAGNALAASGWQVRPDMGLAIRGFFSPSQPLPLTACREGVPVNVNVSAMDGVTYVLINIQRDINANSVCAQPMRNALPGMEMGSDLPRLAVPAGARVQSGNAGGGISGTASASIEFTLSESAGNVARHFAVQLAEQGWTNDANWSGSSTAGSSWSRRADAGALVHGLLSVTALDDRRFVAALRVSRVQ